MSGVETRLRPCAERASQGTGDLLDQPSPEACAQLGDNDPGGDTVVSPNLAQSKIAPPGRNFYVVHDVLESRSPNLGDHGLAVTVGPGVALCLTLLRF